VKEGAGGHLRSRVVQWSPVPYSWVVLVAGSLGIMATLPGQTQGVSVFLDAIIVDLGLSRSLVSTLYLVGTVAGSMVLPFVGRLIDRRGPRLTVTIVAALFALACVWMGQVRGVVTLLVGFTLIRALGQGSLSLVSQHVINVWFVRRRGLAIGLAGIGMAAATAVFPIAVEGLIRDVGWREAYMWLCAAVALTILPIGALLYRGHPERFGLLPDQGSRRSVERPPQSVRAEPTFTPAAARRTLTFWVFVTGSFLGSCLGTGLIFHHYSILAAGGIDRTAAAAAFVPYGIVSALANLTTGYLMDKVPPRLLLAVMTFLLAVTLVMASVVSGPVALVAYGALLGLRGGMQSAIGGSAMAYYFGRAHLGAIKGVVTTILVVGSAFGPLLFSLGLDVSGSYGPVLVATAVPTTLFALVVPFLRLEAGGATR
jgi:MFS transporter, OFA family, oxalate/formate antiporter